MISTRKLWHPLLAAALVGLPASVAAATLSIDGGKSGSIPGGATNDVLGAGNSRDGFYGGQIELDSASPLKFEFLGFEAGFENQFSYLGNSFDTENYGSNEEVDDTPGAENDSSLASFIAAGAPGTLPFSFSTSGVSGDPDVVNGMNPDNSGSANVNFFSSIVGDPNGRSGQSVLLFLDDTGAGDDDNHDDMAIKISAVPVPAGGVLLMTALGGLGLTRRKHKAS